MNSRPITGSRQHRTRVTLPKVIHGEPGRMLSRGRHNICKCRCVATVGRNSSNFHPRFQKVAPKIFRLSKPL